jgi:hypothetical protein
MKVDIDKLKEVELGKWKYGFCIVCDDRGPHSLIMEDGFDVQYGYNDSSSCVANNRYRLIPFRLDAVKYFKGEQKLYGKYLGICSKSLCAHNIPYPMIIFHPKSSFQSVFFKGLVKSINSYNTPNKDAREKLSKRFPPKQCAAIMHKSNEKKTQKVVSCLSYDIMKMLDPDYKKICMRYPISLRYQCYAMMCKYGKRMAQLFETAPALALILMQNEEKYQDRIDMVITGKKVNEICQGVMPVEFLTLKPMAAFHYVKSNPLLLIDDKILFPSRRDNAKVQVNKMLALIKLSDKRRLIAEEKKKKLMIFITKIIGELSGRKSVKIVELTGHLNVISYIEHLIDWCVADVEFNSLDRNAPLNTIKKAVDKWQKDMWDVRLDGFLTKTPVAFTFPDPWLPNNLFIHDKKTYEIRYISNSTELSEEGRSMHHCVSSYADMVKTGMCQIFSVICVDDGKKMATIEVAPQVNDNSNKEKEYSLTAQTSFEPVLTVKQCRAVCNQNPPPFIKHYVDLFVQKKLPPMPIEAEKNEIEVCAMVGA